MSSSPASVRVDVEGVVARLTIDREEAGNSASDQVLRRLSEFFDRLDEQRGPRAVVLTGAGDRYFCSGGDLKAYAALRTPEQLDAVFGRARALLDRIETCPVPVIAAINGWCLGGGSELMLACDIRIASPHARIGFPYNRLSLMPGWHGGQRLVAAVGDAWARYLLLVGDPVDAAHALRIGLVQEVAPEGALARAMALANMLAAQAPLSAGATKKLLASIARDGVEVSRAHADEAFQRLWSSRDHREAEQAFAEKRSPEFRGGDADLD